MNQGNILTMVTRMIVVVLSIVITSARHICQQDTKFTAGNQELGYADKAASMGLSLTKEVIMQAQVADYGLLRLSGTVAAKPLLRQ